MTSNVIQGPWGPPAPGDAPAGMPAYAGLAAYDESAPPPPLPAGERPVMMPGREPAVETYSYADQPLMDTSQSVTFSMPEQPEAPAFANYAPPSPMAPYPSPLPFPAARRGGRGKALGEPPARTSAMLGLSLLVVGVGVAIGARYAGLFGGIAGGLYGGASVNALRTVKSLTDGLPASDHEAAISGTYALLGAGVATYVLYQTRGEKKKG